MKQKQQANRDEAVSTTLEMEAYSMKPDHMVASVQGEDEAEGESTVAVVGRVIHWLLPWRDLRQGWRDWRVSVLHSRHPTSSTGPTQPIVGVGGWGHQGGGHSFEGNAASAVHLAT